MRSMDIFIEAGKKKTFVGAVEWPGYCRWGKDELSARQSLLDYGPRYARVLAGKGLDYLPPSDASSFQVIENLPGNRTTDFGAPDAVLNTDLQSLDPAEFEFFKTVLQACWQAFDLSVEAASGRELRKGPRGGGRDLEKMLNHVLEADHAYLRRLAGKFRRDPDASLQEEIIRMRAAILAALDLAGKGELPAQGPRGGKIWPVRFFVRRVAWHVLDHAWEVEDRLED